MIDDAVHAWFQAHHHPVATRLMLALGLLHNTAGLLLMAGALGAWMWRAGERAWLAALLLSVPGAMLVNVGVKHLVARARPTVADPILVLHTYSFPSGHAAGSAALYTFLALWLCARLPRAARLTSAMVVAAAASMALIVSLSRVYLGVHYASDVLAGLLLGALWTAVCVAVVRPLRHARR